MKVDVKIRGGFVADCSDDDRIEELIQDVSEKLNAVVAKIERSHTSMAGAFIELETE